MKVTVYYTPQCVQCDATKRYLTKHDIPFNAIDLSIDPEAMEMIKELGFAASPVVITDHGSWSGFRISKLEKLNTQINLERKPVLQEPAYKQLVRDAIAQREQTGKAIWEIADEIEKIIREAISTERSA